MSDELNYRRMTDAELRIELAKAHGTEFTHAAPLWSVRWPSGKATTFQADTLTDGALNTLAIPNPFGNWADLSALLYEMSDHQPWGRIEMIGTFTGWAVRGWKAFIAVEESMPRAVVIAYLEAKRDPALWGSEADAH